MGIAFQGLVKVLEGEDCEAALPPDVRKGFAFPKGLTLDQPPALGWKAQPSSRAQGQKEAGYAGKSEAFRTSGGRAAFPPTLTRPSHCL